MTNQMTIFNNAEFGKDVLDILEDNRELFNF